MLLAFTLLSVAAVTCDHSTIVIVSHGDGTASSHRCWVNTEDTCSCECPDLAPAPYVCPVPATGNNSCCIDYQGPENCPESPTTVDSLETH
jgi:hypothetical protein